MDFIARVLDGMAPAQLNQARDYLAADRLVRRWAREPSLLAAEVRGYGGTYHVFLECGDDKPTSQCSCERPRRPCAHLAALALDVQLHREWYKTPGWAVCRSAQEVWRRWPLDEGLDWSTVPEQLPWWRRKPSADKVGDFVRQYPKTPSRPRELEAAWSILSECHPDWLTYSEIRTRLEEWIADQLPASTRDVEGWALCHWMQPTLPLGPVFLSVRDNECAALAVLALLVRPTALVPPRPDRIRALLTDLTFIATDLADPLWRFWPVDPDHLAQADALYVVGRREEAIRLLESELPQDRAARAAVRERLIAWLEPAASLPHRLALAWERGSLEPVIPVRHLLDPEEWDLLARAINLK